MESGVAVLTVVKGRHAHLRGQISGLRNQHVMPQWHVIVSMGDDDIISGRVPLHGEPWTSVVAGIAVPKEGLPLAAARNLAARTASDLGAETLVFLDVDCIPAPRAVAAYRKAVLTRTRPAPAIFCGEVSYLPHREAGYPETVKELERIAATRQDRPRLAVGQWLEEPRMEQFWSLSFAMTADDFRASGAFCEQYRGYGGEDTDFAVGIGEQGGSLTWLGGAKAYHQHHASPSPPVQHLEDIVRNATVFHQRWGWWPMEGWLREFADLGLVEHGHDGCWRLRR